MDLITFSETFRTDYMCIVSFYLVLGMLTLGLVKLGFACFGSDRLDYIMLR
jgi:hypothetical protein